MRLFLTLFLAVAVLLIAGWLYAQPAGDPLIEGFRMVEVASVADAMEQLYGQRGYMAHDMRPLFKTKFAGPAVTVLLKKEEHKLGAPASQGMLDAIDAAAPGSVYVMVRDLPQIHRLQFPVYSRAIVPSTSINHFKFAGANVPVTCAGVRVNAGDIISADEDGVVVIPRAKAAEVLKKAQELDDTEHRMYPFIEKFKSIKEAVAKFGRI
jgi:4-hydroxy-4-methyl-2-oxoglutarate aldolase